MATLPSTNYRAERMPDQPRGAWQVYSRLHGEPVATFLSYRSAVREARDLESQLRPCVDCGRSTDDTGRDDVDGGRLCAGCWLDRFDAAGIGAPSRVSFETDAEEDARADGLPCLECEGLTGHALSCTIGRELDAHDACVTGTAPSLPEADAFHFAPTLSAIQTALVLAFAVLGGVPALCAILSVTAWAH